MASSPAPASAAPATTSSPVFDRPASAGGSAADTVEESGDSLAGDADVLAMSSLGGADGVPDVDGDAEIELGVAEAEELEIGAELVRTGAALVVVVVGRGALDVGRAVGLLDAVLLGVGLGVGFFVAVGVGVGVASRTTTVPRIPLEAEPCTVQ